MKKIAIEEHCNQRDLDILDKRLQDMEEAGIDMQVMSLFLGMGPGTTNAVEAVSLIKTTNDTLAEVVAKYPDKFAGYTTLALEDPEASAIELERAVTQLGLKGPLIFVGQGGVYVDEERNWPIFETAARLDVPVYLHPGMLLPDMREPYMTYPILSMAMWGFAAVTGLHAMRLMCSGIFDKYPDLRIILGHMGEGIPFWMWRMDKHYETDMPIAGKDLPGSRLQKKPSQYFLENYYITTSGMYWPPVLQFVNSVVGPDRILFAADYPPESALEASRFIEDAPLDPEDKEKICHLNAERIFRL